MNAHPERTWTHICLASLLALSVSTASAQRPYPPEMEGSRTEVYKTVGDTELKVWIFEPAESDATPKPAIVFFFGGGWRNGNPGQFEQHCRYLASHGMVAITADYRVQSRHASKIADSVRDGKSAIRWVRSNADRLGIDPNRIVASGGSAGGHIAACTGVLPGMEEPDAPKAASAANALALFNPAVMLAPVEGQDSKPPQRLLRRMGAEPEQLSPIHHIRAGLPPTIIFHGKQDRVVPFASVEHYAELATADGNRCELVAYDTEGHGFFNWRPNEASQANYRSTLHRLHQFLQSMGYLNSEPTIEP